MTNPLKPRDVDRLLEFGATPPPPDTPPEKLTLGRYILHREVGRGAMGVVYEAEDSELKRRVAVKILGEDVHLSDGGRRRFQREAQAAAALSHPNIVTLYDAGEENGRMFLVMEYIQGRPLGEILQDSKGAYGRFLPILEKTARGVGAVHAKGLVHRDLKPGNIFVTGAGEPKVGDFGLAHWIQPDMAMTKPGTAIGTPLYMAPEQVRGDLDDITSRTDVYALGSILYEILTGDPPHIGNSLPEIYSRISSDEPVAPRRINKRVPHDLEAICLKALEKEPERRYPTASAFADDLKRHLDGLPVLARRAGPFRRFGNLVRRQPLVWTLALVSTIAIVLLGVTLSNRTPASTGPPADPTTGMALELQSAFAELQKTMSAMEDLENSFHGSKPRESVDSRVAEIEKTARAVEVKHPRAGSPQAWLGLAEFFARRKGAIDRIRRACKAAPEDPIPPTLLARVCLTCYGEEIPVPAFSLRDDLTQKPTPLKETETMKESREEARAAITRAVQLKMSRHLRQALDFQPAIEAMTLMAGSKQWDAAGALEKVAQDPSLRAGISWIRGLTLWLDNHAGEAVDAWESASTRGWPKALLASSLACFKKGYEDRYTQSESARYFPRGFEILNRLIDLDPSNAEAYKLRAFYRYDLSAVNRAPNSDPTAEFRLAEHDIDDYARLHTNPEVATDEHAYMMFILGRNAMASPADPIPWLEKAVADLKRLVSLRGESPDLQFMLGLYNLQKGQAESALNRDPLASFDASIDWYSRFLKGEIHSAALSNRANAYSGKAEWLMAHDQDPLPDFQRALDDYARTIAIEKINGPGHDNRGQVYEKLASWQADHNVDPLPFLDKGLEDCDKAVKIDPASNLYKYHRALMQLVKARILVQTGGDALPALAIATSDLSTAIQADPTAAIYLYHRSDVYRVRAIAEQGAGKGAAADSSMALALADAEKSCTLSMDPAYWGRKAHLLEALKRIPEAIETYRKMLERDPGLSAVAERIRRLENR